MQAIERSSASKRDYKRAKATARHNKNVESLVSTVVALLLSNRVLPENNRDHALSGDWAGYRECHIKPDQVAPVFPPGRIARRAAGRWERSMGS